MGATGLSRCHGAAAALLLRLGCMKQSWPVTQSGTGELWGQPRVCPIAGCKPFSCHRTAGQDEFFGAMVLASINTGEREKSARVGADFCVQISFGHGSFM